MNIIAIIMLAIVALLFVLAFRQHLFPREEVHNAKAPEPKAPKEEPEAEAPKETAKAEAPEEIPDQIPDQEILVKMRAGLTREQAVEVILNQRDHDAALAKAAVESK
jgi:hypothetical protein